MTVDREQAIKLLMRSRQFDLDFNEAEDIVDAILADADPVADAPGKQTYRRWFTDWPSTHVNAGQTVEVMPVADADPVADAARVEITDEMVERACASFDDLTSIPFRRHQVRRALDAAVNGGKQDAENPRYFVDPPMAGH